MSLHIDKVFEAYEQGQLTRRQVAQALVALLIPAAADAQTSAGAVPARTVNHVQICVADPEKSKTFYGKLFGARKVDDYATSVQTLALPGNGGWISLRHDPKRAAQMDHYAIGVDNFDPIKYGAALKKAMPGATVTGGDDPKSRSVWVTDPDGVRVQVISKERAG